MSPFGVPIPVVSATFGFQIPQVTSSLIARMVVDQPYRYNHTGGLFPARLPVQKKTKNETNGHFQSDPYNIQLVGYR